MAMLSANLLRKIPRFHLRGVSFTPEKACIARNIKSSIAFSEGCQWRAYSQLAKHQQTLRIRPVLGAFQSQPIWELNGCKGLQTSHYHYDEVRIVETPPFAESVSEGDVRWDKGVGDFVEEDEVVGEIETDKTSIPVPAPCRGVILEFLIPDGEKVVPGQQLLKIQVSAGDAPKKAAPDAAAAPPPTPPPPAAAPAAPPAGASAGPIPSTPPPAPSIPTGPMTSKPASSVPIQPAAAAQQAMSAEMPAGYGVRSEQRVKMSRMRQRIAQRLKEAQNTTAMLTTFNEIDMSNIIAVRNKHKDAFIKKHGVKLGFMSAFVKASSYALKEMPVVNAVIDENEIVYRDYVDISVAVATPKGLVVPVLRNSDGMSFADVEKGLNELGEKARSGTLAVEDMDGGTFTISNGGVFGSMFGTPIINPPQSAILGMHASFDRPVAINGKVEIRPMMYIALTYDHRLIDGREAVLFLRKIKAGVEDPSIYLLEM
ncbi:dihydrolipoyllysine-residue succinyltransferase component of 2-oxoglutarate dehydrogenase complex, mitochondrial [Strongylocentrotus purpuratus]|uniref:Dihydrolipoyllysine-residue succinyltransferase component of 2-oxoglutarate dehydrogenase complex, mitochondrial n=1 Tax=Strongylocentrotus purpuratus TaxID=7668 RepID=A0A7M7TGB5_STRPU|nr:dihydrolipoyllysine-residue succinyltransferase component of 2-oxoglutarate dehydrogenase complex, mitochondrial [Strongylocentrotus purpuratus]